jgi:ribonuclease HI
MITKLFTDGSVNPQTKVGFGAYLTVSDKNKVSKVETKKFENTSSTQLELEALLWALESINITTELNIYTDCQNILGLPSRREGLEQRNYHSKTGKPLKHSLLYQRFFSLTDKYPCTFIKVKGHKKSYLKDEVDKLFTLVDKASRDALRAHLF